MALTATTLGNVTLLANGRVTARPIAAWVDLSGHYVTKAAFNSYDDMRVSTVVPNNTNPISVQAVINGRWASAFPWDVRATGHNYIVNLGPAWLVVSAPGRYSVYMVVTFSDGSKSASNNVIATVTGIYVFYQLSNVFVIAGFSSVGTSERLIRRSTI